MNISNIASLSKIYNKQETKKDITFKGKSAVKLIEDLKNNQKGQSHSMKKDEVVAILKYFGYVKDRTPGTSHSTYMGPYGRYGQCITIVNTDNDFQESTKRIKDALDRLDLFNGELILFRHEPSEEEIFKWQEKIRKYEPDSRCHNYYLDTLSDMQDDKNVQNKDNLEIEKQSEELSEIISQQRMAIVEISQATDEYIKRFNSIKDNFEAVKAELKSRNYKDEDELFAKVQEVKKDIKNLLATVQKIINEGNAKFQNGIALSDDELASLYDSQITIEQDLDFAEKVISDLETIYLETLDREEAIANEIQEIGKKTIELAQKYTQKLDDSKKSSDYDSFYSFESLLSAKYAIQLAPILQEFQMVSAYNPKTTELTKEEYYKYLLEKAKMGYSIAELMVSEYNEFEQVKAEIQQVYSELVKIYSDFSANIAKYQEMYDKNNSLVENENIKTSSKSGLRKAKHAANKIEEKINTIKKSVSSIDEYKQLPKNLKNIIKDVNSASEEFKAITEIMDREFISNEEIEKHKKEKLEKTLKKFSKEAQEQPKESKNESLDKTKMELETAVKSMEQVLNPNETEEVSLDEISLDKDELLKKIKAFYTNSNNQKTIEDLYTKIWGKKGKSVVKFSQMLAKQMAPLEFSETIYLLSYLVSTYMKDIDIEAYKNNSNASLILINNIGNKVLSSSEGQRIKNATRFAFLDSVYKASKNKDGQIYTIDKNAAKNLLNQVKQGKKDIHIVSNNKTLNINLENDINLNDINYSIKAFVMPMKYSGKIDKVIDALFEFSPKDDEQLRNGAKEFLKTQGLYYEFLADENCPSKLKKILLETFWTDFDKTSGMGSNIANQTIKNYDEKQKEMQSIEQNKKRLDIAKSINWNL